MLDGSVRRSWEDEAKDNALPVMLEIPVHRQWENEEDDDDDDDVVILMEVTLLPSCPIGFHLQYF